MELSAKGQSPPPPVRSQTTDQVSDRLLGGVGGGAVQAFQLQDWGPLSPPLELGVCACFKNGMVHLGSILEDAGVMWWDAGEGKAVVVPGSG